MAKKSANVPSIFLMAVSAALVGCGCGPDVVEVRNCVDGNGYPLPDYYCQGYGGGYYYQNHVIIGHPSFVYGGSMSGGRWRGYSSRPSEGASIRSSSGQTLGRVSGGSISRGGFGSFGSSRGGSFGS